MSSNSLIITNKNTTRTNSTFRMRFPRAIEFLNKEVAISQAQLYYSNPNIASVFNNNTLQIDYTKNNVLSTLNVTIPDGYYSYENLSGYLQLLCDSNSLYWLDGDGNRIYPITIQENVVYYSATVSFTLPTGTAFTNPNNLDPTITVVLRFNQAFGDLLGFAAGILPRTLTTTSTSFNSEKTPNISPIDSFLFSTNLCNDYTFNADYSNVIFVMNSGNSNYGSLISTFPTNLQFFPINDGTYNELVLSIKDQNNQKDVNFLDYSGHLIKLIIRDRVKN